LIIYISKFISAKNKKKSKLTLILFFNFENLKKNHRWLVTLFYFCPKNLSLYFFHFLHSKTFPKWYHTCILIIWIKSYILKTQIHEQFLTQNTFFSKIGIFTKKNFGQNELTCSFRIKYIFFWAKSGGQTFIDVQYFRVVTILIFI
jgi:hypothetical protein